MKLCKIHKIFRDLKTIHLQSLLKNEIENLIRSKYQLIDLESKDFKL